MPRFFVSKDQINNGTVTLTGDDAHHISRSLRMAVGEPLTVCDMQGTDYECTVSGFTQDTVTATVQGSLPTQSEPPYRAHLYQALPKGDKLDTVIQKSVELGVSSVTTFISERCIAKEGSNEENKLKRRNKIALEAAKQSGRGTLPEIKPTVSFKKMLDEAGAADLKLFCYEGESAVSLKQALRSASLSDNGIISISLVIGSEGGFSPDEVSAARERGFTVVGLGKRILRTETAPDMALSCLIYEFELK